MVRGGAVAGADPAVVGPHLAAALDEPAWAECRIALISGGKSNLTYRVDPAQGTAVAPVVLRRPPLGHVLPTAHDMVREFTVMSALGGTPVPVPRTMHLCADPSVLGAPFYVMELVEGPVCRTELPPGYADEPGQRAAVGRGLVEVLAALHRVPPGEVGLGEFGRPSGYLTRQVSRWTRQWDATRIEGVQGLDELASALGASVPGSQRAGIVHGDYRLDNTVLDPVHPGGIAAVLDWEMSTLGDPLADLAMLLVYWSQDDDGPARDMTSVVPAATALPGFPTRVQVTELYATLTGADLEPLPWCLAFSFFKLAVVCAGIEARVKGGAMVGDGFDGIGDRIPPLVELGRATLADRRLY